MWPTLSSSATSCSYTYLFVFAFSMKIDSDNLNAPTVNLRYTWCITKSQLLLHKQSDINFSLISSCLIRMRYCIKCQTSKYRLPIASKLWLQSAKNVYSSYLIPGGPLFSCQRPNTRTMRFTVTHHAHSVQLFLYFWHCYNIASSINYTELEETSSAYNDYMWRCLAFSFCTAVTLHTHSLSTANVSSYCKYDLQLKRFSINKAQMSATAQCKS